MILGIVSIVIGLISVLLAIRSLKQLEKMEQVTEVKDELKKGKVIFHSDSSSPSAESSSLS